VRYVDPEWLTALAATIGWTAHWQWTYHVLDDFGMIDKYVDRDELVNATPALRAETGRDLLAVWRRTGMA